jgi:hypothetical protein
LSSNFNEKILSKTDTVLLWVKILGSQITHIIYYIIPDGMQPEHYIKTLHTADHKHEHIFNIQYIIFNIYIYTNSSTHFRKFVYCSAVETAKIFTKALGTMTSLDDLGFKSWQGQDFFCHLKTSRPALGPTQPPIQWVFGDLSLRAK